MRFSPDYQSFLRDDLCSFIEECFRYLNPAVPYLHNWHIEVIADRLTSLSSVYMLKDAGKSDAPLLQASPSGVTRGSSKLVVNLPPRYLKSIAISVAWPAWLLGHHSHLRIICASYSERIAAKLTLDCLKVMESDWYRRLFPETAIVKGQKSRMKFVTTQGGFRYTTSTMGSVTGEGGDIIIADDPHNPTFIHSPAKREAVINWFETTLLSRLDHKSTGLVTLVMQRLHPNDLAGHLINKGWPSLVIPAQFSQATTYTTKRKDYIMTAESYLHEEREGAEALAQLRHDLGLENFSAQYLQKPIVSSSQVIKPDWWQITAPEAWPRAFEQITISIDTAQQVGVNNDYSVIQIWGRNGNNHYLHHQYRGKWLFPELLELVKQVIGGGNIGLEETGMGNVSSQRMSSSGVTRGSSNLPSWIPACAGMTERLPKGAPRHDDLGTHAPPMALAVLIEAQSVGQALITSLRQSGYHNITPIHAKLDKLSRLQLVTGLLAAKQVHLPEDALWVGDFLSEMQAFPHSKHDDQLDAMVQYLYHHMQCQFRLRPGLRRVG